MWRKQTKRSAKLEHSWQGETHLNSIINIFINIKDIESTKQKEEPSENIKEPLEIKNTRAEVKTSIKKLKYKVEGISKEVEEKKDRKYNKIISQEVQPLNSRKSGTRVKN